MNKWLEGFAYRIEITPGIFLITALLAIVFAVLTVASQGIRAGLVSPVKSLKVE